MVSRMVRRPCESVLLRESDVCFEFGQALAPIEAVMEAWGTELDCQSELAEGRWYTQATVLAGEPSARMNAIDPRLCCFFAALVCRFKLKEERSIR
jgi:hypothetical protein